MRPLQRRRLRRGVVCAGVGGSASVAAGTASAGGPSRVQLAMHAIGVYVMRAMDISDSMDTTNSPGGAKDSLVWGSQGCALVRSLIMENTTFATFQGSDEAPLQLYEIPERTESK